MPGSDVEWLQRYVDAKFAAIDKRLDDAENKRTETLGVLKDSTREAKETLDNKLQDLNHLQRKMEIDRSTFATKDHLDAVLDKLIARITAGVIALLTITQIVVHLFWK